MKQRFVPRAGWVMLLLCVACMSALWGDMGREQVEQLLDAEVREWRWHLGEVAGAEQPDFVDGQWQVVTTGFTWYPHDSTGWFRTRLVVPEFVNGLPTRGAELRMEVTVDNGAQAYVNGTLAQEFEWADGDFVLTESAQPGESITVALHAVNRPGSGSLKEARLVCGAGKRMVEALHNLDGTLGAALEDGAYVPDEEADHWRIRVHEALQALDMDAYRSLQEDAFLASVQKARDVLLIDSSTLETRLQDLAARLSVVKEDLQQARAAGKSMPYVEADAQVVESFLQYVREDMADPEIRHQLRGVKAAAYLERICPCAALLAAGCSKESLSVPRYQTGPTEIRDGAFWQEGRPTYFTGVGHFGQIRKDLPILNNHGLNIIQMEMGPRDGLPDPDTVDVNAIRDNVVYWLDQAAEHNVAVNLLISPHYFPQWALDADPAHAQCGEGFLKFCIEAPNTRLVMEKWLDALMPMIAGHPALHSICLSNEPQYRGKCGYERQLFQEWLKGKWGTMRQLNKHYGTKFRRVSDIELPSDAGSGYGLFFDACRFNQERFLAFHEMLRDRIHLHAPELPVHAKTMSHAFEDPGRFEVGIDYEKFNQLDRIAGNDCVYAFNGERPGAYACDWLNMAMNYTLQHCTAPDSPIFNSENHLIADGDARYMPEAYIRTVYWQEALHGQGATTTWVWERGQEGDFSENILTRANCVRALGTVALDLNRLAPEVHAFSRAKGDMAVLYAYSSLLPSLDHMREAKAVFEGAYFADTVCDFITESQVEAGDLENYKLVVVPYAAHTPDGVLGAFNRYINKGGTVVAIGPCFTHDEYGRERKQGLVSSGRGNLKIYPDPLSPYAYRDILNRLLDETGVARPVRVKGLHEEPVWGVNLRTVEQDGRRLVSLLNLSRKPETVRLTGGVPIERALDLLANREVTLPLTLAPLEPVLLKVGRE